MSIVTLTIPREWLIALLPDYDALGDDESWLRESAAKLVSQAVLANLTPQQIDDPLPHRRLNFRIPAMASSVAAQRAATADMSLGTYTKGLLAALVQQGCAGGPAMDRASKAHIEPTGLLARVLRPAGGARPMDVRQEQLAFYSQLREVLADGAIGLNEAATGVGKTLAMTCAAAEYAIEHQTRVVVATPTVALLDQFVSTFRDRLLPLGLAVDCRVVLGRQNFVSPVEVSQLLQLNNIDFDPTPVWDWLGSGGYANGGIGHDVPWLASSLEAVAPLFPTSDCALSPTTSAEDPAQIVYRAQFDEDRELRAEVVFVTHAMLANDMRSRAIIARRDEGFRELSGSKFEALSELKTTLDKDARAAIFDEVAAIDITQGNLVNELTEASGFLPFFTAVLIDEAHLFEQSVSTALSDYVSLRAFSRKLSEYAAATKLVSAAACKRVADAAQGLTEAGAASGDSRLLTLSGPQGEAGWVTRHLDVITEATRRLKCPPAGAPAAHRLMHHRLVRDAAIIAAASRFSTSVKSYLQFSPTKAWPQIYVGKSSVAGYLSLLWSSTRAAACVSATLYLKSGDTDTAQYQRMLLNVPESRAREFRPVIPGWLYRPVTGLWLPQAAMSADRRWLRPPTRSDRASPEEAQAIESAWLDDLAATVEWIVRTASGGSMVALTSYDNVAGLGARLEALGVQPLVLAKREFTLKEQATAFLRLRQAGAKPVWLAVGGAWTGLDVGGHDPWARLFGAELAPGDDNVFTDLVVPRLPFGVNKSITHMFRMQTKPHIQWDLLDALFRLKQVIGRPVRRAGLPQNRRIFLLDGRLNDERFLGWRQSVLNLLRAYRLRTLAYGDVRHAQYTQQA
jgi:CRISPR type IV-associated DEAD/DEAH-box helicase Csf4